MAFAGKYEFEGDENYDDFVKKIGLPSDKVEMGRNCKIVTEVAQNGNDFTWTQHFPGGHTTTNTFTIGKEADMETMGGKPAVASGNCDKPRKKNMSLALRNLCETNRYNKTQFYLVNLLQT
uniref:Fatty acid binding protein 6 n=1 Tax=Bubo bubo TaxID=30461 RepID=A0A8C0FJC8_BUBBB